jgi:hypothetical protein
MTLKDKIVSIRMDSNLAAEIEQIDHYLTRNPSQTLRYLLKMGVVSYKLLTSDKSGTNIDIETLIDNLKPERKEKLLELLMQDLGLDEVERMRKKKGYRLLNERTLAQEEKSEMDLNLLPPAWHTWDDIDFHNQSVANLHKIYKAALENQDRLRKYMSSLKISKQEAERVDYTLANQTFARSDSESAIPL